MVSLHTRALLDTWYSRRNTLRWSIGFVYKTEGPCYRKAGAMMLFNDAGEQFGLLSGGCLESDIRVHAQKVMHFGKPALLAYDGSDEDDIAFQLGIGCGGTVHIVLLPITESNDHLNLEKVFHSLSNKRSCTYRVKLPVADHAIVAEVNDCLTNELSTHAKTDVDESGHEWLSVHMAPEPHLLICGGGLDAKPVASIARELGFEVSLWDPRPANARYEHFGAAITLLDFPATHLRQYAQDAKVHAATVMSHNVALDASAIKALEPIGLNYLALLGPASRKRTVLEAAGLKDGKLISSMAHISGPAGLDLGGELPESIALAILAECHAVLFNGSTESKSTAQFANALKTA